jgi:hypothetical protein
VKLQNQIIIVNVGILGGLIYQYYRGASLPVIAAVGIALYLLVNTIFFFRLKKGEQR